LDKGLLNQAKKWMPAE